MELERKIYKELIEWKKKPDHNPLILEGLRQVGKTFLAAKFGREHYRNMVLIDFRLDPGAAIVFRSPKQGVPLTAEIIAQNISIRYETEVRRGETLLIFDEINDCALARSSLKLLARKYDVIATGSLLGIGERSGNTKRSIPTGYEDYLRVHPLDFEEFLWANGINGEVAEAIYSSLSVQKELSPVLNAKIQELFLRYIVIGGMPEVVTIYLKTNSYLSAREKQTNLLRDFQLDFGKVYGNEGNIVIDGKLMVRTAAVFNAIPNQLAKDNKKFKFSLLKDGGKSAEYKDAITWLSNVGLITLAHNVSAIESPLTGNAIENEFKIYVADIGLLVAMFPLTLASEILNDGNLGAYKGAIYESVVAETLGKASLPVLYYADSIKHLENDFLLESDKGIEVIESKSTNGKMASAKALAEGNSPYKIHGVYKLMHEGFGKGAFYRSLPHYAFTFFLNQMKRDIEASLRF